MNARKPQPTIIATSAGQHPADSPAAQPQPEPTGKNTLFDLERAVLRTVAVIEMVRNKAVEVIDEWETEGPRSGEVAAGISDLCAETADDLLEVYYGFHKKLSSAER